MAKATVETVTKTVEKEVEEEAVTLTMSRDEAMAVRAALGCIQGRGLVPSYATRTAKVRNALARAGIRAYGPAYFEGMLTAKPSDGSAHVSF